MAVYKTPEQALNSVFGYTEFRPLQKEIMTQVLQKRDCLAILPTGGGKSLCYQIPALLFPGLTIVVSPLIALMQDQVQNLANKNVKAVFLNSTLTKEEYFNTIQLLKAGEVKLLYLAPESLVNSRTQELLASLRVDCFAIDEAHCISEWGHDFRPEYRKLASIRSLFPHAVCLAMTATATPKVRKDIIKNLHLENPEEFVASFNRSNIFLKVISKQKPLEQCLHIIKEHPKQSGIIYCFSRAIAEKVSTELTKKGYPCLPYHAGLSDAERSQNQQAFVSDKVNLIAATVAFGMGIDKPNIRFIIHHDLPKSIEQYYQEIGRAGRDGKAAQAILLYGAGDLHKIRFLMEEKSKQQTQKAENQLQDIISFAESHTCRRKELLAYFGENNTQKTNELTEKISLSQTISDKFECCDLCSESFSDQDLDLTIPSQKILSCIIRTGERFGASYVTDVLLGSRQKRIIENKHNKLSTFGIGRNHPKEAWMDLALALVAQGYLVKDTQYGVLSLSAEARDALKNRETIILSTRGYKLLEQF